MQSNCICANYISNNDMFILIIGAVLGLLASLITILIQRILDKHGELNIFYRLSYQVGGNGASWGFGDNGSGELFFLVPITYEFQNTSNVTRVIRDVNLLLYNDNVLVDKMLQIEHTNVKESKGEAKNYCFGTEKGSYSFVIEPRSIQRQKCEYLYLIDRDSKEEKNFNKIMISYYDERNKEKKFFTRNLETCWDKKNYPADEEWRLLK